MIVDMRTLLNAIPPALKADFDGELLTAIAVQPNEIIKCAIYLFFGYLAGTAQFARTCVGVATSPDLPRGRNPDEDDRRSACRCMMHSPQDAPPHPLPDAALAADGEVSRNSQLLRCNIINSCIFCYLRILPVEAGSSPRINIAQ